MSVLRLSCSRTLVPDRYVDTSGSITQMAAHASQILTAQTVMAQTKCTSSTSHIGYIFSNGDTSGANGVRLQTNATTSAWLFGADSSGSTANPLRRSNSASATATSGNLQTIAATWDGSLSSSNIHLFSAIDAVPLAADDGTGADGVTAINGPAGQKINIGNRADAGTDRTFNGDIFWVARWNRILSLSELIVAQFQGPTQVPMGLVLYFANGRNWGPHDIGIVARKALQTGTPNSLVHSIYRERNMPLNSTAVVAGNRPFVLAA